MPTLFFADLVRELCQEGGTGPLTPNGAVVGHRRFADAVPPDTSFHYAVTGIAQPGQWETGTGRIDAEGRLRRDSVAASSAGGTAVDFAPGLKTLALTVGAGWYADSDAAAAALAEALAAKQPLSTMHPQAEGAAAGDLVTARRGGGWVNVPMAGLAFRDAAGRYALAGPLAAANGSAGAPALSFSGDTDTGLFRASADELGFSAGGTERVRITAAGLGVRTAAPALPLHVNGDARIDRTGSMTQYMTMSGDVGGAHLTSWSSVAAAKILFIEATTDALHSPPTLGDCQIAFRLYGAITARVTTTSLRPETDNGMACGTGAQRWSVLYAASGTINTSDARDKIWQGGLSAAELAAARRIAGELGFYQWADAIAAKGTDGARRHFGARAQRVWAIMTEEGLIGPIAEGVDPDCPYAFLCWDGWDEARDEEDQVVRAAGDRFGLRTDQLALLLIAAQEARLAALEAAA